MTELTADVVIGGLRSGGAMERGGGLLFCGDRGRCWKVLGSLSFLRFSLTLPSPTLPVIPLEVSRERCRHHSGIRNRTWFIYPQNLRADFNNFNDFAGN